MNNAKFTLKSILFGSLSILLLTACNEPPQKVEQPLRPVRTLTVSAPNMNRIHEFSAVVDASHKADLSFKVSGELIEFLVNQGDEVVSGQVLARLDDSDFQIKLKEAQSSFDKSSADYNRGKKLISKNTISQADFDQLRAQYNSTKSKLDIAKNNIDYTELKASFSGIIAKKYTENFQEISAKSPIVALHDLTNINLKIDVPESIMIRVQRSERPTNMMAKFDAISDILFPLTYKEVSTQADAVTRTYEVTLTMVAPTGHTILPGMTARVLANRINENEGSEVHFILPLITVLKGSEGNYVYTVEDKGNGIGEIKRKPVTVGEVTALGIEIYSGIQEGDKVLSAGMSKVSEGMKVKITGK